jgi:hypothetical protein
MPASGFILAHEDHHPGLNAASAYDDGESFGAPAPPFVTPESVRTKWRGRAIIQHHTRE